jgi:sulfate permease, SulP family
VLAAIVMVAVYGLIDANEAMHLFRIKAIDGWTLIITFAVTLFIGIEQGILICGAFFLLVLIWRSVHLHTAELGYFEHAGVFRNVRRYPEAHTFPEALIVRPDASLYFANTAFLESWLAKAIADRTELRYSILDFAAVNDIDAVALETLELSMRSFEARGMEVRIAGMKGLVRDLVRPTGPRSLGRSSSTSPWKEALRL